MNEKRTYGSAENSALQKDYWKLLRLMILDAIEKNPNGVALLKFDKIHHFTEHVWKEAAKTLASIVTGEAKNVIQGDDLFVSFDETSYLLIAEASQGSTSYELAQKISKTIGLHLNGIGLGKTSLSVLRVVAVEDNQIVVEDSLEVSPAKERVIAQATSSNEVTELLKSASFDFLPLWHVRKSFVMCFECIPRWHQKDGSVLDEHYLSAHFQKHDMEYALDAETVHHAVDQVVNIIENDRVASILVPVHYDTVMEDEGFEKFLKSYGELMPAWRERVSMEIKNLPDDVTFEQVKRALHRLRPYCYGLYVQVPFGFDQIGDFEIDGLVSLGVDLTHDTRDEDVILADMENFVASVNLNDSLHTHALGLQTVSLSVGAICTGFDFIGCKPIDKELDGWGLDDFLVRPIDLYKQLLKNK
ncbi:hypothetical protein MTBPR1_150050 [Candidatus Terasakiella magnetica]|uniref:Uncharacterized protein n=1 Tax=Candidatus Terasakiella magnetica TaxID=1867952 RepID=A0A1C3RFD3_9PROT|nr:hypothetical protein [Candidatus Terasakiella magnetica]SCA56003.1 hypothetical protein MTBPR1_150050 [Candidatus Terasakiella magnetica]